MRFKLLLIGLGIFLGFRGYEEVKLKGIASSDAQEISCADLVGNGPGENAHVVISDFMMLQQAYVYEGEENDMETVWIPAVPLNGPYHIKLKAYLDSMEGQEINSANLPMPQNINLVVKSSDMNNDAKFSAVAEADTIQGMVINEIEKLSGDELKIMRESYPGIDFSQVYILEHNRKPSGAGKMIGFFGGGALLSLVGLGLFFVKKD